MTTVGHDRANDLLTVAKKLFDRYGYRKTTLSDLAHELGITKSTLYHYYKNKEDLFREVMKFWLKQDRARIRSMLETIDGNIIETVARTVDTLHDGKEMHRGMQKNNWVDFLDTVDTINDIINDHYQKLIVIFADYFEKSADQGYLVPHSYKDSAKGLLLLSLGAKHINDFFLVDEPWSNNTYTLVNQVLGPILLTK